MHRNRTKKDDKNICFNSICQIFISTFSFFATVFLSYIVLRKQCHNMIKTKEVQTTQMDSVNTDTNEKKKIINRIKDIKDIHNKRMDTAIEYSDKISLYIRYLAITGLGLIWLLVEKNQYKMDTLLHNHYAQIMLISCLLTLILELVHLIMNVVVNLLYANSRLRKPLSYVARPRKTQHVATKYPRIIVKIQWAIWFVKIICLMVALLVFVCCLLYKMFG